MNELLHIKDKFDLTKVYTNIGISIDSLLIYEIINNAIHSNSPDIISESKDSIYGIEHFEFDCYKNNKKGNYYEQEKALVESISLKKYITNGCSVFNNEIKSYGDINI